MSLSIIRKHSPHHGERVSGAAPSFLIVHYTESPDVTDPDGYFMATIPRDDGTRVSAHYMIDIDGTATQYVGEDRRAWHAGASEWEGIADINSHSIGIELVNGGTKYGYTEFADAQIEALIALSKDIMNRHGIPARHVLGHADVAPGRKIDPDYKFPWKRLAGAGVGVWPQPIQSDFNDAAALLQNDMTLKRALAAYGYNPALDLPVLVTAFQRHFQPEAFTAPLPFAGTANDETALRLSALLRQKLAQELALKP